MKKTLATLAVAGIVVGALLSAGLLEASPKPPRPSEARALGDIDLSAMDPTVDACQNFYQRACGGFVARAQPTAEHPEVAMTDEEFQANLKDNLARLFAERALPNSELGRLETFYSSCLGKDPSNGVLVRQWLARIDAARSRTDIQSLLRALTAIGVDPFFTYAGVPDPKSLSRHRAQIDSSQLWQEPEVVVRAFELSGMRVAKARLDAARVTALVTHLRKFRNTSDNDADYENPRSLAQLREIAPAVDWRQYYRLVSAKPDRLVNLTSATYMPEVSRELATRPIADLRAYLRWAFLFSFRGELPSPYNQAFGSIGPALSVDLADADRRCRDATVRAMGVEFSREYSERILGLQARDAATAIAKAIRDQIVASVRKTPWLSPDAREQTANKLAHTDLKIGFPDQWPSVGHYPLSRTAFFDNVLRSRQFEAERSWRRAGQPRSRKAWDMIVYPWVGSGMAAARLVVPNGFPDATTNSLIMTAAYLTPPRFVVGAAPELNYASFGAIFAHEFVHVAETHQYDELGREREMWSKADVATWDKRRQCVIDQAAAGGAHPGSSSAEIGYHQYSENVADLGGVRLAYAALAARLGDRLNRSSGSGFTPAQRFFYKYAQHWCTAATAEDLAKRAKDDPHALPEYRVNGPLSNLPEFAQAFGCKSGSPMSRPANKVCRMW